MIALHGVYTRRSSRRSVARPIAATIASCKHAISHKWLNFTDMQLSLIDLIVSSQSLNWHNTRHRRFMISARSLKTRPVVKSVAKYCDEYVCLSVCLSVCPSVGQDISRTACAIFTNFLCMLPMSVARSFSGTLTIGRIAYRREGVTDMHSAGKV